MNVWRWIGVSLFLLGTLCWITTSKPTAFAGGKDKDKDSKVEKEKDDKGKDKDKDKDDKGKGKDKDGKDKDKDKKEVVQPVVGAADLPFTAFDPKSKPFFQQQFTKTVQTMTVMGQKVVQNQEQTFMIQWTPKDKADKNYVVVQKIVGVKMKIDIGGNKIEYDSTAKNPKNPMTDFFEALMKEELTFYITPELTVEKIDGQKKFVENLTQINPQMAGLLKAILDEKALKKMAEPTWWAYPKDGKVSKDLTWKKDAKLELGPIGTYNTEFTFTYKGEKDGKDTIGIATTLKYEAPTDKAGLPFVITKANLKGDNGKGEAIFNRKLGRFESTSMKMDLTGDITIDVGNMTTTVDLNQNQEAMSTTLEANPWVK